MYISYYHGIQSISFSIEAGVRRQENSVSRLGILPTMASSYHELVMISEMPINSRTITYDNHVSFMTTYK